MGGTETRPWHERRLCEWRVRHRSKVLDAWPWLRVWKDEVTLPDGRLVDDFYRVDMPEYVIVLALTPEQGVLVLRQYKHGVGHVGINLPAGYVEEGEDVLAAARRELLEETGYNAEHWRSLGSFTVDGNRGCGTAHLFLARDAREVQAPDAGDLEEYELASLSFRTLTQCALDGSVPVLAVAAAIGLAALALTSSDEEV